MLIRLLHIVAAIVLAAGAFFAIQNRSKFKEARVEKNRINREEVKPTLARLDERIAEIEKEIAVWRDAHGARDQKQIALTAAQANIKAKTQELSTMDKEITDKTAEVNKLETDLQQILGGVTIDELNQTVERLGQEIAGLKTETETQAKEFEVASSQVQKQQEAVSVLQRSAAARNKGIGLNSLEATVVAVNPGYGFAVINAGENRGISPDSKLIVKRGDQRIGLLTITTIEGSRTIADIVAGSVPEGTSIAPGDRVIVEKMQR